MTDFLDWQKLTEKLKTVPSKQNEKNTIKWVQHDLRSFWFFSSTKEKTVSLR